MRGKGIEIRACTTKLEETLDEMLEATWKTESIGISDEMTQEEEDKMVVKQFKDTVKIKDGKMYVRFPFKPNKNELTDNFKLSLSRLHSIIKMREARPEVWKEYVRTIQEQLDNDILEDFPENMDSKMNNNPIYHFPHQAVVRE